MNIFRSKKHTILINLITVVLIMSFLCQNMAWASIRLSKSNSSLHVNSPFDKDPRNNEWRDEMGGTYRDFVLNHKRQGDKPLSDRGIIILDSEEMLQEAIENFCRGRSDTYSLILLDMDMYSYKVRSALHGDKAPDVMVVMDELISSFLPKGHILAVRLKDSDEYILLIPSQLMEGDKFIEWGKKILEKTRSKKDWPNADKIRLPLTVSGIAVLTLPYLHIKQTVAERFHNIKAAKDFFGRDVFTLVKINDRGRIVIETSEDDLDFRKEPGRWHEGKGKEKYYEIYCEEGKRGWIWYEIDGGKLEVKVISIPTDKDNWEDVYRLTLMKIRDIAEEHKVEEIVFNNISNDIYLKYIRHFFNINMVRVEESIKESLFRPYKKNQKVPSPFDWMIPGDIINFTVVQYHTTDEGMASGRIDRVSKIFSPGNDFAVSVDAEGKLVINPNELKKLGETYQIVYDTVKERFKLLQNGREVRNIDFQIGDGYLQSNLSFSCKIKVKDFPPKGTPATLLRYMYINRIFSDNPKKSIELAKQRGGNDSQRTIQRELRVLQDVGLVQGDKRGYYLAEWVKMYGVEEILKENPELKIPSPTNQQLDAVIKKIMIWKILTNTNYRPHPSQVKGLDFKDIDEVARKLSYPVYDIERFVRLHKLALPLLENRIAELFLTHEKAKPIYIIMGRDGEMIYDAMISLAQGTELADRIHMININRYLAGLVTNDPNKDNIRQHVMVYLAQNGVSEEDLKDKQKFVFIDAQYVGSIFDAILAVMGSDAEKMRDRLTGYLIMRADEESHYDELAWAVPPEGDNFFDLFFNIFGRDFARGPLGSSFSYGYLELPCYSVVKRMNWALGNYLQIQPKFTRGGHVVEYVDGQWHVLPEERERGYPNIRHRYYDTPTVIDPINHPNADPVDPVAATKLQTLTVNYFSMPERRRIVLDAVIGNDAESIADLKEYLKAKAAEVNRLAGEIMNEMNYEGYDVEEDNDTALTFQEKKEQVVLIFMQVLGFIPKLENGKFRSYRQAKRVVDTDDYLILTYEEFLKQIDDPINSRREESDLVPGGELTLVELLYGKYNALDLWKEVGFEEAFRNMFSVHSLFWKIELSLFDIYILLEMRNTCTPATLLQYMYNSRIFSDNPKKSKEMARQRGSNDSIRTIQRELKVLKAVGIVEDSPKTGYYLSDWLRDIEIEDIIRENPELNLPNPDARQIRTVVERISFILQRDFWNRKVESGLENERLEDRRYVDTVLRNVPYTSSKILTLGEGPFVIDVEPIVRAGHHVMATDFSGKAVKVLERKKSEQVLDNLEVRRLDYRDDFNLPDGEFNMVISRLAIGSYDSDDQFREILLRIKRVLKKDKRSRFVFQVKSVTDSSYGKGERVAEDFFVEKDPILTNLDHYSHFWRREKLERILREAGFRVNAIDEYNKQIYKEPFGIFSLITFVAELEEDEAEDKGITGRQKRITERFIDTVKAGLTKNKGRKTILALDTDIGNIKELGINELLEQVKEVSNLLGEIEFIAESGNKLPGIINDRIKELTANRKISQSDIDVVIVTKREKGEFDASYHVTRVNGAKLESSKSYVPILELLTFALRVNLEENNDMLRDELKQIYNEITGEALTEITRDFVEKIKRGEFLIPLPPTKKISSEFYNEAIEILRSA